ncbi:MAG: protein phosphatase CheZ [Steroidobacteraceae bacterium]
MPTANALGPVWEDLRALNASLQRTLTEFRSSFHRASVAGKDMPDARLRLDHVLKLTEDAAHRTLDLVERSGPLAARLATDAAALVEPIRVARAAYRGSGVEDLLSRVETFLTSAERDGAAVRANLDEVLMAQSYQDLSGQIIRTVIKLVVELERTLAHFSKLAGDRPAGESDPVTEQASDSHGHGPAIPGATADAVGEQQDVDALLAMMGM